MHEDPKTKIEARARYLAHHHGSDLAAAILLCEHIVPLIAAVEQLMQPNVYVQGDIYRGGRVVVDQATCVHTWKLENTSAGGVDRCTKCGLTV